MYLSYSEDIAPITGIPAIFGHDIFLEYNFILFIVNREHLHWWIMIYDAPVEKCGFT